MEHSANSGKEDREERGKETGEEEGRGRTNFLTRRREVKDEEPKSHQTWVITEPSVSCLLNTF